jgi:hypothetical protein
LEPGNGGFDVCPVGDVGAFEPGAAGALGRGCLRSGFVDVEDPDPAAFLGQPYRGGSADATGASGQQHSTA